MITITKGLKLLVLSWKAAIVTIVSKWLKWRYDRLLERRKFSKAMDVLVKRAKLTLKMLSYADDAQKILETNETA
jgi:hypothetical protein